MPARLVPGALAFLALVALVLSGCSTGSVSGAGAETGPEDRPAAPAFTGELLDGSPFVLADLEGSVVVLNFWGSWCAPCRAEAPELAQAHESTRDTGAEFVGVNVKDQKPLAAAFVDTKGLDFDHVFDPGGSLALQMRQTPPNAIPSTVVLDKQQRVAAVWLGPVRAADLEPVIRELAAEPA